MIKTKYENIRDRMKPGDLIAFGGYGFISNTIKSVTNSNVSHVGTILQTNIPTIEGFYINQVIESVGKGKGGLSGVVINRMSDHIRDYEGDIWWLPLNAEAREKFDQSIFFSFMLAQVGKPYDAPQAIGSALDFIPDNREDLDKLYCSELVAAGYEKVEIIGEINASEQTPIDDCNFPIFDEEEQIKGTLKKLKN